MKRILIPNTMTFSALGLVVIVSAVTTGCDQLPDRPPLGPPLKSKIAQQQIDAQTETIEAPTTPFKENWDVWYEYNMNGRSVGYSHIRGTRLDEDSRTTSQTNVRFEVEEQLAIRRGDSNFVQHLSTSALETLNGRLSSFESELLVGPIKTSFAGSVKDRKLTVETVRGSARTTKRDEWDTTHRGLVAVEQSLRRNPMTSGEKRSLKILVPIQHKIATVELICSGLASVAMKDGSYQQLIEIVSHESLDGKKMSEQVLWTDEAGRIQKTLRMDLIGYRSNEATATANAVNREDVINATTLDVKGVLERPMEAKHVGFVVSPNAAVQSAGGTITIPTAPGQFVRKMENGVHQVFITPRSTTRPRGFEGYEAVPADTDIGANRFFDFNTPMIAGISSAAVKSRQELGARELLTRLLPTTDQVLTRSPMDRGLTKASEVARTARGDSTDYAVLMATLLRRSQIPARLAIGLVYVPGEGPDDRPKMRYHVWTIAYIDNIWLPLDPQLGRVAPPDRLTLATTNLSEGNEYNVIARVLDMLGRISVEIKAVNY